MAARNTLRSTAKLGLPLICIPHGGTNGRGACQTMTTMPTTIQPAPTFTSVCRKPVSLDRGLLRLGLLAAGLCAGLLASAANWPQHRGPGARGLDESQASPTNWNIETGANIRWQTPLPGLAHASPIVWGDRVYIATAVKAGKSELKVGLYGDITPLEEKEVHQWRLLGLDKTTGEKIGRASCR